MYYGFWHCVALSVGFSPLHLCFLAKNIFKNYRAFKIQNKSESKTKRIDQSGNKAIDLYLYLSKQFIYLYINYKTEQHDET
jgi:hypothetical protein